MISKLRHKEQLTDLEWVDSEHIGTANKLAGFGASGEAIYVDLINNSVQSLSGTSITFDWLIGYKGELTLTGNTTLTITNLPDGCEGQIEITNGATAYTFDLNGSTGYTTEVVMGNNAAIDSTVNSHTTLIFWRSGSTLYYGFLYDN